MKDIDIQYIVGHGCTQYHALGKEPFAIMCDSLILTIPIIFFFTRNNPFLDPSPVHTSKSNWREEIGDSWWWASGGLCSDHSVGAWEMTFYLYTTKLSFRLFAAPTWDFFQEHTAITVHASRMKVMKLDLNCLVLSRTQPASITLSVLSHK